MYEFKLPDVGEGIHEAEVLKWLVKVGDEVVLDQPILEIQTDKAIVEIPSPVAGTVAEIRAEAGTMANVGDTLIVFETGEAAGKTEPKAEAATSTNGQQAPAAESSIGIAGPGRRVLAAPYVRKLALEMGIELAEVPGSGPAGRVLPEDIKQFAEQKKKAAIVPEPEVAGPAPAAQPEEPTGIAERLAPTRPSSQEITDEEPLQGLRRRIAERMELAWQIPHVTSFEDVDATHLVALRRHLQPEVERRGGRLTYLPFIVKATVQALKENPHLNASLDMAHQKIKLHRYYHIGIATAVSEGLLVPVVRHADQMSLHQIAVELTRLSELAQQRKLDLQELSGSTFTITNFGSFGGYQGTPIINPPEVAILGVGRLEEKSVVNEGQVVVRPMLPLALSYDHRLIDGAAAGQFLRRLKALLADPNLLFLELV
jgi:pyruvate dehydrogenase E2 component (dihydrolipoamide acetyltransferase)